MSNCDAIIDASILDSVQIAAPCSVKWDSMEGKGERVRFCGKCNFNVYNISDMSKKEAEAFLLARTGKGRACMRLFRRADGTIITDDCPVGLRKVRDAARHTWRFLAALVALLICGGAASAKRIIPTEKSNDDHAIESVRKDVWTTNRQPGESLGYAPERSVVRHSEILDAKTNVQDHSTVTADVVELSLKGVLIKTPDAWQRAHSEGTETAMLIVSPGALIAVSTDESLSSKGKAKLSEAVKIAVEEANYTRAAASLNNVANHSYYAKNQEQAMLEYRKALDYAKMADPAMDTTITRAIAANIEAIEKLSEQVDGDRSTGISWFAGPNGAILQTPLRRPGVQGVRSTF